MPGRVFSREFKVTLVKAIANGEKTNTQICREHQIDQSVLTRWKREYRDRGDAAFTPSPQEQAQGEVEVLQARIGWYFKNCVKVREGCKANKDTVFSSKT
jgi:transposase-like protein